jgi:hypothetical protein
MTEVTLDAELVAQLKDGQEQLKLRDASGRVLGYFVPANQRRKSPFSRDEIERRLRVGAATARPLSEVLAEFERRSAGHSQ